MEIGAIIQSRMSSKRLPGKVLQKVEGKSLLQYIFEKCEKCETINAIVVATSTEESDDPISNFCQEYGIACFRGSLTDVAGRFNSVLERESWDAFIRINGDSPLIDRHLIDKGVSLYQKGSYDIVTNVLKRSYPSGQSIEVINANLFKKIYPEILDERDHEHVTRFFYHNPELFAIYNFTSIVDYSNIHLSVDTDQDMILLKSVISLMTRPHWDYTFEEIITMYHQLSQSVKKG